MFPDLDPSTLQATLDAHEGSIERTVDYLLSSHAPSNLQLSEQEEQDAALARQLQAEDAAHYEQIHQQQFSNTRMPATTSNGGEGFGLPSLADVQSAVQPLVNGVAYAGRVAANSVSGLYRELLGDEPDTGVNGNNRRMNVTEDESVVLRGEGSSPAATRSSARQRRPETSAVGRSFGDKKDD